MIDEFNRQDRSEEQPEPTQYTQETEGLPAQSGQSFDKAATDDHAVPPMEANSNLDPTRVSDDREWRGSARIETENFAHQAGFQHENINIEKGSPSSLNDSGYGMSAPPTYRYNAPEKVRRGLMSTLSMVLIGAILGSALTMASGWYLINEKGLLRTPAQVSSGTTIPGKTTSQIVTSPPADTGVTSENQVAADVTPSVVGITTKTLVETPSFLGQGGSGYVQGVGSGVILSADGYIITNSHVVDNGEAGDIQIVFSDETTAPGEVLWSDAALDLAIVKTNRSDLKPVVIGSSDVVQVGDKAIAIGNPLGLDLQSTLTSGYVSGLDRSITLDGGSTMSGLIQTDAAINEGNSGGALLNSAGQLIGINTAKAGGTASGIGFAIPIDTVKPIIEKVMTEGTFKSVYMGVTGMNVATLRAQGQEIEFEGKDGVFIMEVMKGTAAQTAGLASQDVITKIEDQAIDGMTDLKKALLNYAVGDKVQVTYFRGNSEKTTELTFAQDSSTIEDFFNPENTQP